MMGKYLVEINEQSVFVNTAQIMQDLEKKDIDRRKSIDEEQMLDIAEM
jgi:hypothetical protein